MFTKKIPTRSCIGCCKSFPKRELKRIVRTPSGEVMVDLTGKKNGRGAYICSLKCFETTIKKKKLGNALKVDLDEKTIENLSDKLLQIFKKEE